MIPLIISSAEMQTYYDVMQKQSEVHGERQLMNKLYDGACCWTMTNAGRQRNEGKENRKCVSENAFSILGFT